MFRIVKKLVVVCALLVGMIPASAQNDGSVYVLVHGAFQDASGWAQVKTVLEGQGNTVIAVDNAGRGSDTTPISEITLATYRDAVVDVINQQDAPVILVGHSFGGVIISAVAEVIPAKIVTLVYVAAYLPQDGESLITVSSQDHYSLLGQEGNLILAEDFTTGGVNKDIFASAFCPDCSEEQAQTVVASQLDEPLAPLNESVSLTADNFGSVRKVYILTAQDVIVSPQLQALMLAKTPVDKVYAVDAGHAPYITVPDRLAEILVEVAAG